MSWYLDDVSIVAGVFRLRSRDAASDPDGDGVDNEHELLRGSNPEAPDTDLDGVADGIDNCPSVSNAWQQDVVHPGAGGDACDDPDGDGLPDEADFCPDTNIPETRDTDLDGLGNACDPYPDLALYAVPRLPEAAIVGAPVRVTWELRDRDGALHPELSGVRAELRLSGAAVFGETALAGRLLAGGGTPRALVEFVEGIVTLEVGDATPENVVLDLVDVEGIGIAPRGTYLESFDAGAGGFASEPLEPGAVDRWSLGPGPGGSPCYSAPSCWTSVDDAGAETVSGALVSPVLPVSPGIETLLRFVSIKEPYHGRTGIEVSIDGAPWDELGGAVGSTDWQEAIHLIWQEPRRTIRFRFTHRSIPGEATPSRWAIDEFRLEGSASTLLFLEGAADRDGDGISNAEELLNGGSTGRLDGDGDGFDDPRDNCPGVSNHDQYDAIVPDGLGDLCGDADGDGTVDAADPCPEQAGVDGANADGDRLADACDPYPLDALFVLVDSPQRALSGQSIALSLRLVDAARATRGDLRGVRVALTAHGPAVFSETAIERCSAQRRRVCAASTSSSSTARPGSTSSVSAPARWRCATRISSGSASSCWSRSGGTSSPRRDPSSRVLRRPPGNGERRPGGRAQPPPAAASGVRRWMA